MKEGLAVRQQAVRAMTLVTEEKRLLSDALPALVKEFGPGDRARVQRLATGGLRWASRADRLLGPHLRMKPEDPVLNALRLAIFEIYQEDAPHHAVVDAAVSMTSKSKQGLVNGVLRNLLRREPDWNTAPVPTIPKWLRKQLNAAWGKSAVIEMEKVFAADPPLDLILKNPEKSTQWAKTLGAIIRPDGGLRLSSGAQVTALPGYETGDWWVQDAGASIGARLLDPQEGERILDLCAAPGGKTMQLAATNADVTALDLSETRMARVTENLKRTNLHATTITADVLKWTPEAPFDAILLDAPCSATGTLRRHPDLAYARDGSGIDALVSLQSQMLGRALDWLTPSGRLVYCTCSLLPSEGEDQIATVIEQRSDIAVKPADAAWLDPHWITETGTVRVRPDHWSDIGGIDGFFIAEIRKHS